MSETKQTKKASKTKKPKGKSDNAKPSLLVRAVRSEKFPKVMGVFLSVFTVFSFVCFVSFFWSWSADYTSMQEVSPISLLVGEQDIRNWGGPLGAFISYAFIRHTFGIASFGFIVLSVFGVLRLFKCEVKNLNHKVVTALVLMLWVSVVFGFLVVVADIERLDVFAGTVGIAVNYWLKGVIGKVGALLFLLAFTIVFPMLLFNVRYRFIGHFFKRRKEKMQQRSERKRIKQEAELARREAERVRQNAERNFQNKEEEEQTETNIRQYEVSSLGEKGNRFGDPVSEEEEAELTHFEIRTAAANQREAFSAQQPEEDEIEFVVKDTQVNQPLFEQEEPFEEEEQSEQRHFGADEPYDPRLELSGFIAPTCDMLIDYEKNNKVIDSAELRANKERIVSTLKSYSIEIVKITATPGPTVTLYEIVPAQGTRINKIKNLEDDIALSLSALGIRIIAPIPGKGTIGIEVPNSTSQIVSMRTMLTSPEFLNNKYELPVAIGKTISSEPFVADLAKMPHLLMAGATGQGKSVGLNAIIASLLFKKHPCELKFVMVDPKKVELSLYSKIERHYLAKLPDSEEAIITDVKKVVRTLNSLCIEMDQRYDLLKAAGCKKITEYNAKFCSRRLLPTEGHRYLPYIVLIIDEFADLIMTAGKEVELPIARLAQLARAVGIHLIIATQRPTVNIITGTIKANFPARVAFKVSSKLDSRTILDSGGAEQLIGRGDMLISLGSDLIRLQCALIDTEEIESLAEYIGAQRGFNETFLLPEYLDETSEPSKEVDMKQLDDKFVESARLVVLHQHGSTSLIQRKLSLGYNRAGRIIDQLEAAGIVGAFEGSKAREVLVKTEAELEEILKEYTGK